MPPAKRSLDGKDPRAGGRYVWHKLRNTGVDYTMILRERRQWLLNQDLAKSETLLCEWFALVQELDAVTREELGVDKFGTKVVTQAEESERRARSRSFNVKTSTADANPYGIEGANRPRSNSFLEFLFGQEDLQNGLAKRGSGAADPGGFAAFAQSRATLDGNAAAGTTTTTTPGAAGSASGGLGQGATFGLDNAGNSGADGGPKKVAFMKKKKGERAKSHSSSNGGGDDNGGFVAIPPSPSPSAGGNGAPLVLSIKKKKKSKTPNKALKKMFKVVEKKASGKGFQPDGGGGGGSGGVSDPPNAVGDGGMSGMSTPSTPGTPASTPASAGTDEEGAGRVKSWL